MPDHYYIVLAAIVALAIAGILLRSVWSRIVCWILSLPPLAIGVLALWQGGIAEPFTRGQMIGFCAFAFAPAAGCTLGELSRARKKIMDHRTSQWTIFQKFNKTSENGHRDVGLEI